MEISLFHEEASRHRKQMSIPIDERLKMDARVFAESLFQESSNALHVRRVIARLDGYKPASAHPECPYCWMVDGVASPLTKGTYDIVACPLCACEYETDDR